MIARSLRWLRSLFGRKPHYIGYDVVVDGKRRTITAYDPKTKTKTLDKPFSEPPTVGDSFLFLPSDQP